MTTSATAPPFTDPSTPPCPPWCQGTPHHDWDSGPEGHGERGHSIVFGDYVHVFAAESQDRPGELGPAVLDLDSITPQVVKTAERARGLAADLIAAAAFAESLA